MGVEDDRSYVETQDLGDQNIQDEHVVPLLDGNEVEASNNEVIDQTSVKTSFWNLSPRTKSLMVVYAIVLVDLFGFGILFPVLPYYAFELNITPAILGAIYSLFSCCEFVGSIVLGRVSDRYGRRTVLIIGLIGSITGHTLLGLYKSIFMLCMSRAITGFFAGTESVAQAYIYDTTEPHERSRYMSFLGTSVGVGMLLGPIVGGQLQALGFQAVAFTAAGLCGLNLIVAIFFLQESHQRTSRVVKLQHFKEGCNMFNMFSMVSVEVIFAVLAAQRYHFSPSMLSYGYLTLGLSIAASQGLLVLLMKKLNEKQIIMIAFFGESILLSLLPFVPQTMIALLYTGVAVLGLLDGVRMPTLTTLISFQAKKNNAGFLLGVYSAAAALSRAVSPSIAGLLYEDIAYYAPFIAGTVSQLMCIALISTVPGKAPESNNEDEDSKGVDLDETTINTTE